MIVQNIPIKFFTGVILITFLQVAAQTSGPRPSDAGRVFFKNESECKTAADSIAFYKANMNIDKALTRSRLIRDSISHKLKIKL